jgi:hypothetical protein
LVRRILVAAYLVEAGLLLLVAPWMASWQQNYFAARFVLLSAWMSNPFVRGGISGVGLVTAITGVRDLAAAIFAGRSIER